MKLKKKIRAFRDSCIRLGYMRFDEDGTAWIRADLMRSAVNLASDSAEELDDVLDGAQIPRGMFVKSGRTGQTDPHDVNRLALIAYALQIVEALSERGQCSKDVSKNARALNKIGRMLGTRYVPGMDNEAAFLRYIKERLAVLEDWKVS